MDPWIRLFSFINLAGAIHAVIQAIILWFVNKGNRRANKIMAAFLLTLAIGMANGFFNILHVYNKWPALSVLVGSVILAYGPLFYLYVRAIVNSEARGRPTLVIHGLPFLLGTASYAAFLLIRQAGWTRSGLPASFVQTPWLFIAVLALAQTMIYTRLIVGPQDSGSNINLLGRKSSPGTRQVPEPGSPRPIGLALTSAPGFVRVA